MYKGFVLSESLKDPTILNDFKQEYVKVEYHPENKDLAIWHNFKVLVTEDKIEQVGKKIAEEMKETWYAHFWNESSVYVILPNKIFKIPREEKWQTREYQECRDYAVKHGVEERYLEFGLED